MQTASTVGSETKPEWVSESGHVRGGKYAAHVAVALTKSPEKELAQDVWDMRRLKADYPKHIEPAHFIVDFRGIPNFLLRQQVKQYFRLKLPGWKAGTFFSSLHKMMPLLRALPPDVHMGNLNRQHVEHLVARSQELSRNKAYDSMKTLRAMLRFMSQNAAWAGPRPPRFLMYPEDMPHKPVTLPRPIPPDVVAQFDLLLNQAVAAMATDQAPPFLSPMLWDALLILRRTGMRAEDVCHLKAPDANGRNSCLDQDSDGYWWIRMEQENHKMDREHRIPTKLADGTVDAIRRQTRRSEAFADYFGSNYLFRDENGTLTYKGLVSALRKLTAHLLHEGKPYRIVPHQFRHTIATEMIETGVDPYMVKEFLGHTSLDMTEKYIKVYLATLKARYDEFRSKQPPTMAAVITHGLSLAQVSPDSGEDSGWVEGKVGKLYRSPLPGGLGVCVHLPMLDPCPSPPVCGFCPKLCVEKRHLPRWEIALENHQQTLQLLAQNPSANDRAIQRHRPYLEKARQIVETVQREGFYDGRIHNC